MNRHEFKEGLAFPLLCVFIGKSDNEICALPASNDVHMPSGEASTSSEAPPPKRIWLRLVERDGFKTWTQSGGHESETEYVRADIVKAENESLKKKAELWDYYQGIVKAEFESISQLLAIAEGARMIAKGIHKVKIQIERETGK